MSATADLLDPQAFDGNTAPAVSFTLRGQSTNMMVLKLYNAADPMLFTDLGNKVGQAPNFFRHAPVVLDLTDCPGATVDFKVLVPNLKRLGLIPVGIQGGPVDIQSAAANYGLGVFRTSRPQQASQTDLSIPAEDGSSSYAPRQQAYAQQNEPDSMGSNTLIITEPVRSGRQVYAPRGDLVVLAPVSAGAELIADGSIHVYSSLRGRALAGLSGDTSARIFAHSLEAELISIAGLYRVSEDIEPAARGKAAQVFRDGENLKIRPLI
jgi:septum site-determining protein MinC